ncbi:MAG: hypothetical protein NTX09_04820, partial [Verrucomicrobia bacterium]|nr:hypothetical protein [Verrucomicrobiota bacterium]
MKKNPSLVLPGAQVNWSRAARQVIAAGALLLSMSSAIAQTAVSTLAGSSPLIASGNAEGTGTAARFNALASVAVDSTGNIYVADASNHTIRKVTPAGVVTTLAGSGIAGNANGNGAAATFSTPSGVATDNTFVYVADTGNHAIRKIQIASPQTVTTLAGSTASPGVFGTTNDTGALARFWNPSGLAVSGTDLYVADTNNNTIRKVTAAGVVTTFAGTAGTTGSADLVGVLATFQNPSAIAAEGTTNLYVADRNNNIIRKIVIGTAAVTTLAGTANGTGGSTDSTGAAASFKLPGGLVVSGANLFVADTGNNTIRQITLSGTVGVVTTIAGSAGAIGTTDAIGTSARFQGPKGIGVSTLGTLYIADTNNHTLRTGAAAAAPTVTNPAAATVAVGANPTFTVATTGNPTPTIQWERQAANTTGFAAISASATYSGVGTAALTVTNATLAMSGDQFRASVTNGVGAAVVSLIPAALTVQLAPTISSAATANFSVNTAGTFTVTATGSPAPTFSVLAGSFPSWATLSGAVISGTPTNNTGSPFNFTLRASNGVGTASDQAFVLT